MEGVMLRRLLSVIGVSSLLIAATLTAARAADMPLKAPPLPLAPAWSWGGLYIGIEGGGGWGHAEDTDSTGFDSGRFNVSGGLIGGTIGYNWQFNQFVLGLEGDGSWADINGSTTGTVAAIGTCGGAPPNCNSKLDALGTIRGRIGITGITWNNVLPYVTGGLAVGSLNGSEGTALAAGAVGSGTTTVDGWTLGGGLEARLGGAWSVKAEYLYIDLGNHVIFNDTLPSLGGAIVGQSVRYTANIARVGLNYRFDWIAPKY
jgi:outer membrane immunogenic protein